MDFQKKVYNTPSIKISASDMVNWLRQECSEEELSDIIIELLSYGDKTWEIVSANVAIERLRQGGTICPKK